MPVSAKNLITLIKGLSGSFNAGTIAEAHSSRRNVKKQVQGKKKRDSGSGSDREKIDETLRALVQIGYLEKTRSGYRKSDSFIISGTLRTVRRADGLIVGKDGSEYAIKEEEIGNAHNNDLVEAELVDYRRGVYYAKVLRVTRRKRELHIARVDHKTRDRIFYRLIDVPGAREAFSVHFPEEPKKGELAVVQLVESGNDPLPLCTVEESFSTDDEDFDVRRISVKHSLPGPHPRYDDLDGMAAEIPPEVIKSRKDYRKLYTVTIDGERAKDFDDAISLETTPSGHTLYVHIADVSHYVHPATSLDKEAAARATSFYIGNSVIPMLPEILSNDLCSLREGVDRLTLSVEMFIDRSGKITGASCHNGIIRVSKRLTYEQAHDLVEGGRKNALADLLRIMHDTAQKLKKNRMGQGRVDLNLTDSEYIYDGNTLVDLIMAIRLKSHIIVEEFMLSANETVSRILRENKIPTLYRIHESISDEKLTTLSRFLQTMGLSLRKNINTGSALQEVIDRVRGKEFEEVVNFIILKSFMQAYYGVEPLGHFGLGFKDYTHFTSPIRRYPDLIVHRCLKSLIDRTPPPYTLEELSPIGEKSSEMERLGQNAERDMQRLKSCRFMQDRIGEVFDAVISGISRYGFYVSLLEKPVEGMVPLRFLTDDYYLVNEDDYTIIGKRLGRRFRLGDRVRVRLVGVEIDTMRIDFDVA
jgi:ribonuclease R